MELTKYKCEIVAGTPKHSIYFTIDPNGSWCHASAVEAMLANLHIPSACLDPAAMSKRSEAMGLYEIDKVSLQQTISMLAKNTEGEARALVEVLSIRLGFGHAANLKHKPVATNKPPAAGTPQPRQGFVKSTFDPADGIYKTRPTSQTTPAVPEGIADLLCGNEDDSDKWGEPVPVKYHDDHVRKAYTRGQAHPSPEAREKILREALGPVTNTEWNGIIAGMSSNDRRYLTSAEFATKINESRLTRLLSPPKPVDPAVEAAKCAFFDWQAKGFKSAWEAVVAAVDTARKGANNE